MTNAILSRKMFAGVSAACLLFATAFYADIAGLIGSWGVAQYLVLGFGIACVLAVYKATGDLLFALLVTTPVTAICAALIIALSTVPAR